MKDIVNRKVKFRESFRPFAPAVPLDDAPRYFSIDRPSPFMLMTVPVITGSIPAVTHVDGSARVQTVEAHENEPYHRLLRAFGACTGIPVLMNTSLNTRGRPIAMTPSDAIHCFLDSDMDCLVLGNCLLEKKPET